MTVARATTIGTETVWGTAPLDPAGTGTVLARATVKAGVAPGVKLGFFCSQHGRMMNGSLAVPAAPAGKTVQIDGIAQMGTAKWVVGELLSRGRVRRAYLGIVGQTRPIDRLVARRHTLSVSQAGSQAVEIISVEPRGPAAIAGLREGDLIVALNERAVRTVDDMHRMLVGWPFGDALKVGVIRGDRRFDVSMVPVETFRGRSEA